MLKKSDDFQIALLNYRNTPPKGHTYSSAQRMLSRRTRTPLPTPDHLLEPMSINRDTITTEIKAKRNASKAHYDKTAGPEHNAINIGKFVYARPPTSKPGTPWTYGRVTDRRHSTSYTIKTPRSTIRRNRIHIRRAAPPPPTSRYTPPTLLPTPGHNLAHPYHPQGSTVTTPKDQPTQQPLLTSDTSNSGRHLNTFPYHHHKKQAHLTWAQVSRLLTHPLHKQGSDQGSPTRSENTHKSQQTTN